MTLVLGVTGGIASGKSTADRFFQQNNIPIIDSDLIARAILDVDRAGYRAVVKQFGPAIIRPDRTIDRAKLGRLVFGNQNQLKILDSITHPLIFQEIQAKITQNKQAGEELVIVDAPLLFETGGQSYCDRTLLIALPADVQVKRLMQRDHLTQDAALARIHSQMPLVKKEKLADYVVFNTGTIEDLEAELRKLLVQIKEEDQHGMS